MLAPTHVGIGVCAATLYARMHGLPFSAAAFLVVCIGSLAPDIDGGGSITRPGSILQRVIGRRAARLVDAITTSFAKLLNMLTRHRGFFHWPLLGLLLVGVGAWFEQNLLFWFGWGYLWHLIADAFTKGGIPLLAPFSFRVISLGAIRVGSLGELLVAVAAWGIVCVAGFGLLPEHTQEALRGVFR